MLKSISLSIALFLLLPSSSHAGFWGTAWEDFSSPVTTQARYYLLGGSALTAALTIDAFEDTVGHDVQNETTDNRPLGDASHFGDLAGQMIPNAIYAGTMYGFYYFNDDLVAHKKSLHMIKSTVYSGLVSNFLKKVIREPRPNNSTSRESFPSGHTTTAFAFASVIGTEHEWYWGVAAYTMATFVAYSRINDNAHRLHDVVGGAVLGLSYGLSIHYLYKDEKSEVAKISVMPFADGAMVGYQTTF